MKIKKSNFSELTCYWELQLSEKRPLPGNVIEHLLSGKSRGLTVPFLKLPKVKINRLKLIVCLKAFDYHRSLELLLSEIFLNDLSDLQTIPSIAGSCLSEWYAETHCILLVGMFIAEKKDKKICEWL